jgi:ribonucleoside-diphosphate reductase alpha chain
MNDSPALSENALRVLKARYLKKDSQGKVIETPLNMFRRVSRTIASAESKYNSDSRLWETRFFDLMSNLRFLPNSPVLMNAGKKNGQLAACFVLPVDDSMQSIFDTLRNAALILKSGGGTGFSFTRLRPSKEVVSTTGGIASGPVSFMRIYNTATDVIRQGGARRGANMGILRVDHPDILDFIRLKRDTDELTNFNTSVAVTDSFISALRKGKNYTLKNPKAGGKTPRKKVSAKKVFDEMVSSAWKTGDPGVIFIDRINRHNPTPDIGDIESTNPCGEQPLLPFEACVLGSLNLGKYVPEGRIDYSFLANDISSTVRFLDNAIDINNYPIPEIKRMHRGNRKIGLGVMGWAEMLVLLGIPYHSEQALRLAGKLMRFISRHAWEASMALAEERGAFPNFRGSIHDRPGSRRVRNATVTTIAPTGTISIIADCSSGIEPIFAIANRRAALGGEILETNRHFFRIAEERGFYSKGLHEKVLFSGTLRGIRGIPTDIRRLFKTAHEIPSEHHIRMQAAFQRHTDNAVSKTINLPPKATRKEVADAFLLAYKLGCKGVTVFRYGSSKTGTLHFRMDKSTSNGGDN